jgi:hypothetical protein
MMMSLALYLASLIPQGSLYPSGRPRTLLPERIDLDATPSLHAINPQLGMQIIFTSNGTLNMKVFSLNYSDVTKWFNDHNRTTRALEEFENEYSSDFVLERTLQSGNTTFEYFPFKVENATVIVSNPNSAVLRWSYNSKDMEVIAAPERVIFALMTTAPLGVALTVPWIFSALRDRRRKKKPSQ